MSLGSVIADLLGKRFAVQRVVVVCDRGMVAKKVLAEPEAAACREPLPDPPARCR